MNRSGIPGPPPPPLDWRFDPLDALARWPVDRPVVMLHSGRFNPQWARWSLLAEPVGALRYHDGRSGWVGERPEATPPLSHDPFRDLEAVTGSNDSLWVGYLGYNLGRVIERLDHPPPDDRGWPEMQFQRCPGWLVHDAATGRWHGCGSWAGGRHPPLDGNGSTDATFHAGPVAPSGGRGRGEHEAAIRRVLDYIAAGDVFQVNLAQRFTASFAGSTRGLFRRLAAVSPAWYGAYVELLGTATPLKRGGLALCSTSPELFLRLDPDGRVITRPIKGTRPATDAPDALLRSEKDAAELHMIVDLLRNDLGRVCDYGSVRVTQPRTIESHPTVHHGVATVEGRLHPSRSLRHLLRAMFPGGSVTGAPKVRAMQIIDELEPVRRGPYCGAIGYVMPGGVGFPGTSGKPGPPSPGPSQREGGQQANPRPAVQFNLAIRTMLADPASGRVDFSVGGGIVADSDPADEYDETLHKAAAMLGALRPRVG